MEAVAEQPRSVGGPTGAGPTLLKCWPPALIAYIGGHHIKNMVPPLQILLAPHYMNPPYGLSRVKAKTKHYTNKCTTVYNSKVSLIHLHHLLNGIKDTPNVGRFYSPQHAYFRPK